MNSVISGPASGEWLQPEPTRVSGVQALPQCVLTQGKGEGLHIPTSIHHC